MGLADGEGTVRRGETAMTKRWWADERRRLSHFVGKLADGDSEGSRGCLRWW